MGRGNCTTDCRSAKRSVYLADQTAKNAKAGGTLNKATTEGTKRFAQKFASKIPADHFHSANNWSMSSIGAGTYLGEMDDRTDRNYESAIGKAIELGCNVIDTAINYRFQRSERNVGNAVARAIQEGKVSRDELVISTKGGFLSFDGDYPSDPTSYIQKEYIQTGICTVDDIIRGMHCMAPAYLENQLERSLKNLQLDSIDIYFVHNPETQLSQLDRKEFSDRILAAFQLLERKVQEGKIQIYGTATWDGYRTSPRSRTYLSLEELAAIARVAGGENHHFRAIQLPYNLGMPEAFVAKNQTFDGEAVSTLEAARQMGIVVLTSASILQGQLSANLPAEITQFFQDFPNDAQRAIQFVRSTPGVTSALVGMSNVAHVEENLLLAQKSPMDWRALQKLFE
jgi:aryl-alcohol dehydrogenase-like predicted oxidoreductase